MIHCTQQRVSTDETDRTHEHTEDKGAVTALVLNANITESSYACSPLNADNAQRVYNLTAIVNAILLLRLSEAGATRTLTRGDAGISLPQKTAYGLH